jgi:hypothetical protein
MAWGCLLSLQKELRDSYTAGERESRRSRTGQAGRMLKKNLLAGCSKTFRYQAHI